MGLFFFDLNLFFKTLCEILVINFLNQRRNTNGKSQSELNSQYEGKTVFQTKNGSPLSNGVIMGAM